MQVANDSVELAERHRELLNVGVPSLRRAALDEEHVEESDLLSDLWCDSEEGSGGSVVAGEGHELRDNGEKGAKVISMDVGVHPCRLEAWMESDSISWSDEQERPKGEASLT